MSNNNEQQLHKIRTATGFIAALDQSGGSTPKALQSYGNGVVASFSRALSEGLSVQQTDEDFNAMLDASIESIFQASST